MAIKRVFLDWNEPGLAAGARWLVSQYSRSGGVELSEVIVVVPGSRAGRRLLELLVQLADGERLPLFPPRIVTEQALPELLYQPKLQFADALTQQLAWSAALRGMPTERLAPLVPRPPAKDDTPGWLALADTLRHLHTELAADGLDCGDVLRCGDGVTGFAEHARWRTLCEVQQAYLRTLDRLALWDRQTARLKALELKEIHTDCEVVLLGMVDLNRAQRQMLDQIAGRVTALVVAPQTIASRFDEHGCVIPAAWTSAELPLADEQIERVDGPADQAAAVRTWLASLGGRFRADEIVVGVPDSKLAPQIERELAQAGVETRTIEGTSIASTGPFRLLEVAAAYAAGQRFSDLASLVRHPDVFDWLAPRLTAGGARREDLLTTLDRYACERLPARIDLKWLEADADSADFYQIAKLASQLVQPLGERPRPLHEWAGPLRQVLLEVYGQQELDRNIPAEAHALKALEQLAGALDSLASAPQEIAPTIDARRAVRLVLDGLGDELLPPPLNPNAIELLGWLELPLDDAPALVVTTFNEHFVPKSSCADAFLPNSIRSQLGLLDNDRRLARDAYALSVLLASRRELRLIVAHRDAEGAPLKPSRLLFATSRSKAVARAQQLFAELTPAPRKRRLLAAGPPPERTRLAPPPPVRKPEPLLAISVTKLRDYLACPYRFYLRHVLGLEELSDDMPELDGGAFGSLIHSVLEQFGRATEAHEARQAVTADPIMKYLDYQLDRVTAARYGQHVRPAVKVQVEQARQRLLGFAHWQAARTAEGWQIAFAEEEKQSLILPFAVGDGRSIELKGRIDRIDFHPQLRRLQVLDYKTADGGAKPDRTHLRSGEWIDLQLPLYRHLASQARLRTTVKRGLPMDLGYILLPRSADRVELALAEWDNDMLTAADERARAVLRGILDQVFWPPTSPPPDFADDVAVICQDRRMGGCPAPTAEAAEAAS